MEMIKILILILLSSFLPACSSAKKEEITKPTDIKEWSKCAKDSECMLVLSVCGITASVNSKYQIQFEELQLSLQRLVLCSDFLPPSTIVSEKMTAKCIESRCTAVNKSPVSKKKGKTKK